MRDLAARYPQAVEFDSQRGIVKWKSDLLFALGSDVVMDSAKGPLEEFARIMSSGTALDFDITVVGHTDNTSEAPHQLALVGSPGDRGIEPPPKLQYY